MAMEESITSIDLNCNREMGKQEYQVSQVENLMGFFYKNIMLLKF